MTTGTIEIAVIEQVVSWCTRQSEAHPGLHITARLTRLGVEFDLRMRDDKDRLWSCGHLVPYVDLSNRFLAGWPAIEELLNGMLANVLEKVFDKASA